MSTATAAAELISEIVAADLPVAATPMPLSEYMVKHEAAVEEIVGMIRAKYEDAGKRSFDIGKRAFEHAQWQRGNLVAQNPNQKYADSDFTRLMGQIRDGVRYQVPIKPESIRIADWTRCHVLRELVRKNAGDDVANCMSMYEYLALVGKALHFTVQDLEGDLNPCWLDMIKSVSADRSNGIAVQTEDFHNRVAATVKLAADAKLAKLDPAVAAAKVASDAIRAKGVAKAKTEKAITDSIDEGIKTGVVSPESALAILESVAKAHSKPLVAASVGFDPATCTLASVDTLIAAMYASGKLVELKHMVSKASRAIDKMEKAKAKRAAAAAIVQPEPALADAA